MLPIYPGYTHSWLTPVVQHLYHPSNGLFLDVGANVGQTLLQVLAAHEKAEYVGFEPNPWCAAYLGELVRRNRLVGCQVVPAALSDCAAVVALHSRAGETGDPGASLVADLRPGATDRIDLVATLPFDTLDVLAARRVGFVKIDVEGAELSVLRGMRSTLGASRPPVACEVLLADRRADLREYSVRTEGLMALLGDLEYVVFRVLKPPGEHRVDGAERVYEFPVERWTLENKHMCDYLLLPREREAVAGQLIGL